MCRSEQVNPARTLKEKRNADHYCSWGHICFLTCTDVYGPWEPLCAAGHYTPVHSSCSSISTASSGLRSSSLCVSVMFHVLGSSKHVPYLPNIWVEWQSGSFPSMCGQQAQTRGWVHYRLLYPSDCFPLCSLVSCPFIETYLWEHLCRIKRKCAGLGWSDAAQLCYDLSFAKPHQIFWIYTFSGCGRSKGTWTSSCSALSKIHRNHNYIDNSAPSKHLSDCTPPVAMISPCNWPVAVDSRTFGVNGSSR